MRGTAVRARVLQASRDELPRFSAISAAERELRARQEKEGLRPSGAVYGGAADDDGAPSAGAAAGGGARGGDAAAPGTSVPGPRAYGSVGHLGG